MILSIAFIIWCLSYVSIGVHQVNDEFCKRVDKCLLVENGISRIPGPKEADYERVAADIKFPDEFRCHKYQKYEGPDRNASLTC